MADDELMPCLRCGEARNGLGALVIMICRRYKEPVYRVHCSKCGSDSPERLSREGAVDAQNARVPDPALAAQDQRIAELEAAVSRRDAQITDRGLQLKDANVRIAELEATLKAQNGAERGGCKACARWIVNEDGEWGECANFDRKDKARLIDEFGCYLFCPKEKREEQP